MARRSLQLDVLRGIAILLVLGRHWRLPVPDGPVGVLAETWFTIGWLGVDLFFVLSGFLIGGLLLTEYRSRGRIDVTRFLTRRALKIYPPYFVLLAYLVTMPVAKAALAGGSPGEVAIGQLHAYWPNLVFLQNYVGTNPAAHTWTLAVEEHFYLLLPVALVALVALQRMSRLVVLCLFLVPLAVLSLRCASVWSGDSFAAQMSATHLRLDALLFGVGLKAWSLQHEAQYQRVIAYRVPLLALGCLLWFPNLIIPPDRLVIRTLGLTITFLGAGAFLLAACGTRASDFGLVRPAVTWVARRLAGVGAYTYAIYLWHVTVTGVLERQLVGRIYGAVGSEQLAWLICATAISAGAILMGVLSTFLVERPVLALRDRVFPSRSTPATVGGASAPATQSDLGGLAPRAGFTRRTTSVS